MVSRRRDNGKRLQERRIPYSEGKKVEKGESNSLKGSKIYPNTVKKNGAKKRRIRFLF